MDYCMEHVQCQAFIRVLLLGAHVFEVWGGSISCLSLLAFANFDLNKWKASV